MATHANSPRSNTGAWLLLACIAIVSLAVAGSVLKMRYETGESYPYYSSLRTDPVGTRALYEALDRMPELSAERNFMPLDKLPDGAGKALLLPGVTVNAFNSSNWLDTKAITRFAASGGRVIIAMNPAGYDQRSERIIRDAVREAEEEDEAEEKKAADEKKQESKDKKPDPKPADKAAKTEPAKPSPAGQETKTDKEKKPAKDDNRTKAREKKSSFASMLHIRAKPASFTVTDKGGTPIKPGAGAPFTAEDAPEWMSNNYLDDDPKQNWDSAADSNPIEKYIDKKKDAKTKETAPKQPETKPEDATSPWKILAVKGDRAMIAERKLGTGSVVVCTDRYFLSNEALWQTPKPVFLSWLIGDAKQVIFEETHLGSTVGDEEGIMTLARRYHMHGLFLGGILLFALFIWRSSMSLVPGSNEEDLGYWRAGAVAGRSTASGLEGLLRRGVAQSKLLQRCFDTWETTRSASVSIPADRRAKAKAALDLAAGKHPVTAYKAIRDALHPPRD